MRAAGAGDGVAWSGGLVNGAGDSTMPDADGLKPGARDSAPRGAGAGRLSRKAVRAWLALRRRRVRLIGGGRLPASAAILRVCRRACRDDVLALVAACDRPLAWLVDEARLGGGDSLLASGIGAILYHADATAWHLALRTCAETLRRGGWVVVFDDEGAGQDAAPGAAGMVLACEGWASAFPEQAPVMVPVQLFRPAARDAEVLIHVGDPVCPDADEDSPVAFAAAQYEAACREACGDPVFGLSSAALGRLLGSLEQALRDRLEEEWAEGPRRRQKVDGFRLSPLASESVRAINRSEPEALVALLAMSEAARETARQCSLAGLRAEFERGQLSPLRRFLGWAESILGLPVACYGALNHLVPAAVLLASGLVKWRRPLHPGPWLARALVVLGCYAAQIALVDHFLGRAAAGYYAAALPVSGAYLARYAWLLEKRTRVLLLGVRANRLRTSAGRKRKVFHERLNATLAGPESAQRVPAP